MSESHALCWLAGFDPWDESNKGLADLLETEENASTMPRCIGKEKRDSTQQQQRQQQQKDASNGMPEQAQRREKLDAEDTISREGEILPSSATVASWQEEFRSVFPNVNISFSGEEMGGNCCVRCYDWKSQVMQPVVILLGFAAALLGQHLVNTKLKEQV